MMRLVLSLILSLFYFSICKGQVTAHGVAINFCPHNLINAGMIDVDYNKEFVDMRLRNDLNSSVELLYYKKKNLWKWGVGATFFGYKNTFFIDTEFIDEQRHGNQFVEKYVDGLHSFEHWRLGMNFLVSRSFEKFEIALRLGVSGEVTKDINEVTSRVGAGGTNIVSDINGASRSGYGVNIERSNVLARVLTNGIQCSYSLNNKWSVGVSGTLWLSEIIHDKSRIYDLNLRYNYSGTNHPEIETQSILSIQLFNPTFQAGFNIQYLIPFRRKGGDLEN
jgi:hypothetical protein